MDKSFYARGIGIGNFPSVIRINVLINPLSLLIPLHIFHSGAGCVFLTKYNNAKEHLFFHPCATFILYQLKGGIR
jgi:hypothetical protein